MEEEITHIFWDGYVEKGIITLSPNGKILEVIESGKGNVRVRERKWGDRLTNSIEN